MKTDEKKPEYMTLLSVDKLVPKTHGRIVFRGCIDMLEAEIIEAQVIAVEMDEGDFCSYLSELLEYIRAIMAAEVKEKPLAPPFLFGKDADEIYSNSNNSYGEFPPLPSYTQGRLAARINTLRARVREVELVGIQVFGPEGIGSDKEREDIILALNRLSSALWWLFCEYNRRNNVRH